MLFHFRLPQEGGLPNPPFGCPAALPCIDLSVVIWCQQSGTEALSPAQSHWFSCQPLRLCFLRLFFWKPKIALSVSILWASATWARARKAVLGCKRLAPGCHFQKAALGWCAGYRCLWRELPVEFFDSCRVHLINAVLIIDPCHLLQSAFV